MQRVARHAANLGVAPVAVMAEIFDEGGAKADHVGRRDAIEIRFLRLTLSVDW